MLCRIISNTSTDKGTMWVVNIPDATFMRHMAVYGRFTPSSLTDLELSQCVWLGRENALEYAGPYEQKRKKK